MPNIKKSKIIISLQILFFSSFVVTLFLAFIIDSTPNISFMQLDIFAYLYSIKFGILSLILMIILLIELFFGRIFCSFICPMGNLIAFFDWLFKGLRKKRIQKNAKLKYIPLGLLIILLILRLFKINLLGFFDPISIINRFFVLTFGRIIKLFSKEYSVYPILFDTISVSLLFIISLSFLGERIWCKYLCPLGFIHRILSLKSIYIRSADKCTNCNKCIQECPVDAIDYKNPVLYDKSQCILCFKCIDVCPTNTKFIFKTKKKKILPGRREFLKTSVSSLLFLAFLHKSAKNEQKILRPPGATNKTIITECLRCMECVNVCPTNVLQSVGLNKGILNLYTPEVRTDLSYCDYECNLCGEVCPTNAIPKLKIEEKQKWKIGKAVIDRNRCLVWSKGIPCLVCEEYCPVPEKAIKLKPIKRNGKILKAPVVDTSLCIGCGICQNKCPVDNAAIVVNSL